MTELLEWPEGTRLEVRDQISVCLWWRDDDRETRDGAHWFTGGGVCGATWGEMNEHYGEQLADAVPLYPPGPARRTPGRLAVVLDYGEPAAAWGFPDYADAQEFVARGGGDRVIAGWELETGTLPVQVTVYTGWMRVAPDPVDCAGPTIVARDQRLRPPGVRFPCVESGADIARSTSEDDGEVELWCVGEDEDEVLANLRGRAGYAYPAASIVLAEILA